MKGVCDRDDTAVPCTRQIALCGVGAKLVADFLREWQLWYSSVISRHRYLQLERSVSPVRCSPNVMQLSKCPLPGASTLTYRRLAGRRESGKRGIRCAANVFSTYLILLSNVFGDEARGATAERELNPTLALGGW
jgi:hypothetical protein